jgi:hypothetical protein
MPKAGEIISLREWAGKPYRSKQRELGMSAVTRVEEITLRDTGRELLATLGGESLSPEELNAFARNDGFNGAIEMFDWLQAQHGLPFTGIVIHWK